MEVFVWLALVLFLLLYPRVIQNLPHKSKVEDSRGLAKRLTDTVISAGGAIFVYALIVTTSLVNLVSALYKGRWKSNNEPQYSLKSIERLLSSAVKGSPTPTSKESQLEVLWALDNARTKHRGDTGDVLSNDSLSDFWDPAIPESRRQRWISWLLGTVKGHRTALKESSDEGSGEYLSLLNPTHETKLPRGLNTFTNYTLTVEMGDARSKTTSYGDAKSPSIGKTSHTPIKKDIEVKGCTPHKVSGKPNTPTVAQRAGDSAAEPVLRKKLNVAKARTAVTAPAAKQQTTTATQTLPEILTNIGTQTTPSQQLNPIESTGTQTRPFYIVRPARTSLATQTSVTTLSHTATQTKSEHYITIATQTRQFRPPKPPRAHVGTQTRPELHFNRGIQTLPYRPPKPPHRSTAVQTNISQTSIAVQTCASFPFITNGSSATATNTEVSAILTTTESDEDTTISEAQPQFTSIGCQTFPEGEQFVLSKAVPETTTIGTQTLNETETPTFLADPPLHLEEPKDTKHESEPMGILLGVEKSRSYRKKLIQSLSVPQDDKLPIVEGQPTAETPKTLVQVAQEKQPKTVHYISKVTAELDLQRGLPDIKSRAATSPSLKADNQEIAVQSTTDSKSEYRVMERIKMLECRLRLADVRCQRWSERMAKAEEVVETLQDQVCILNTTLKDMKTKDTRSVKCVKTVEQQVQVSLKDLKSVDVRSVDTTRIISPGNIKPMEDISGVITKTTFEQQIEVQPTDHKDTGTIYLSEFFPKPKVGPVPILFPGPLQMPRLNQSVFSIPPAFSKELSSLIKELRREMETQLEETNMKYRISNISVESFETAESSAVSKYAPLEEKPSPRSLVDSDKISAEEQIIKITMNEISDSPVMYKVPVEKSEPCKRVPTEIAKKTIETGSSESSKRYKKLAEKLDEVKMLSSERKYNNSENSAAGPSERFAEKKEPQKPLPKERKRDYAERTSSKGSSIEKPESTTRRPLTIGRDSSATTASNASAAVTAAAAAMAAESEFSRLPTPGGTGDAAPFHSIQVSPVSSEEETSFSSSSDGSGGQRRFVVAKASSSSTTRRLQTGPVKVLNLDSTSATNYILTCYEEDA